MSKEIIQWSCPRCGRSFSREGQQHSCVSIDVEGLFRDKRASIASN